VSDRADNGHTFVVCCCTVLVMLGVGIISPILPLYAVTFGVSYSLVGIVVSIFGLTRMLTDMPAGLLVDKVGKRPLLLIGLCLFAVAAIIAVFAASFEGLLIFRSVQGIAAGIFTISAMTYLFDVAPPGERGKYMGWYQGALFLGMALGPALGGFLAELGGFRTPFLSLFVLAAASSILAGAKIPEGLPRTEHRQETFENSVVAVKRFLSDRNIVIANFAGMVIYVIVGGIRFTAIPLYAQELLGLSAGDVGIILGLGSFANFLVLLWTGSITDRLGRKPILTSGFALVAAVCYSFVYSVDFLSIAVISVLLGVAMGTVNPGQITTAIDPSDPIISVSVSRVFSDVGLVFGPLLVGLISDQIGLTSPFVLVALLSLLVAVSVFFLK
jgi:DHA1 family multidrug resistance protein-like MFS transporter